MVRRRMVIADMALKILVTGMFAKQTLIGQSNVLGGALNGEKSDCVEVFW
jgi:hypothetical protein